MEILFVGKEWKFKNELKKEVFKKVDYNTIRYIDSFDIDFNPNSNTLIVTNKKTYPLVARILATLTNQELVVKDDFLVPKNAKYSKNSFLIEYFYQINVILLEDKLPEIFLTTPEYESINIFRFDKDTVTMFLDPIFNAHKIDYVTIQNEGGFVEIITKKLDVVVKKEILKTIPTVVFGDLFTHIVNNLPPKKITFAESCTGGLLASSLTKIPGSSNCFDGSVVTYSNKIKNEWLGVEESTLNTYGAVSEQTVKEMLAGAIEISKADYAIAISGIAGPTGATPNKPVGTVFIGVSDNKNLIVEEFHFKGSRNYIQYQAMMNSIRMFINFANLYTKGI